MRPPGSSHGKKVRLFTYAAVQPESFSFKSLQRRIDKNLVRRVTALKKRLEQVLGVAAPKTSYYLRSGVATDLADLWHAGEELRKCLKELLGLRFPRDQKRFRDLLLLLDPLVIQQFEWHVKQLKRRRTALLRSGKPAD